MFPRSYFPDGYFPPGYFPKVGAEARAGGVVVGAKPHARALMQMVAAHEYNQSILDDRHMHAVREAVMKRSVTGAWLRKLESDHQQKCLEWAAFSVVLSEV